MLSTKLPASWEFNSVQFGAFWKTVWTNIKLLPNLFPAYWARTRRIIMPRCARPEGDAYVQDDLLTCICLMAGVRLVKRDVRPSHDVTSDHHANLAHPAGCISQYDRKTVRHTGVWGEGGSLRFMADESAWIIHRIAFNPTPASSAPSKAHTAWAHRLIQT